MQMSQFNATSTAPGAMRLIRKSPAAMKARQYQIVAVVGTIESESRYQVRFSFFIFLTFLPSFIDLIVHNYLLRI